MHLPLLPRWVALAALRLLHWLLALEERLTLWWQTGRWAARDWAQAAVEWATPGAASPPVNGPSRADSQVDDGILIG